MTLSHPVLVVFVTLALSVSFAIPADDVAETAYDESEALPVESVPTFAIAAPHAAARAQVVEPKDLRLRLAAESELCRIISTLVLVFSVPKPLTDLTVRFRC